MKRRTILMLALGVCAMTTFAAVTWWSGQPNDLKAAGANLLAGRAQATEKPLKAGMIDPKTGKKIKYWVAPMDPTYIRNEPGQSPMGMDLVIWARSDSLDQKGSENFVLTMAGATAFTWILKRDLLIRS